jgi:hypothetical protein
MRKITRNSCVRICLMECTLRVSFQSCYFESLTHKGPVVNCCAAGCSRAPEGLLSLCYAAVPIVVCFCDEVAMSPFPYVCVYVFAIRFFGSPAIASSCELDCRWRVP